LTDNETFLGERAAALDRRELEPVRARLRRIRDAVRPDDDRTWIELLLGGWIGKPAHLAGLTDTDAVVVLGAPAVGDIEPASLPKELAARLGAARLDPAASIATDRLAVTVAYPDYTRLRLLPAVGRDDDVRMADATGDGWFGIGPRFFATELLAADARADHRLIPMIRLTELVLAGYPQDRQLDGYHVETLAIAVYRGYSGPWSYDVMLRHFFMAAASAVLRPLVNSSGESLHIDDALGPSDSERRRGAADLLAATARQVSDARGLEAWERLIPSSFDAAAKARRLDTA
jgi:hypothetical protein